MFGFDIRSILYLMTTDYYCCTDELINMHQHNNYQQFKTFFDEGDKELHEKLRQNCELILLNNR